MPYRSCLGCGELIRLGTGSRCPDCSFRKGSTRAWRKVRAQILASTPNCYLCGRPADEVDHIVPLSRGGTDDPSNLRAACLPCNRRKGAR